MQRTITDIHGHSYDLEYEPPPTSPNGHMIVRARDGVGVAGSAIVLFQSPHHWILSDICVHGAASPPYSLCWEVLGFIGVRRPSVNYRARGLGQP